MGLWYFALGEGALALLSGPVWFAVILPGSLLARLRLRRARGQQRLRDVYRRQRRRPCALTSQARSELSARQGRLTQRCAPTLPLDGPPRAHSASPESTHGRVSCLQAGLRLVYLEDRGELAAYGSRGVSRGSSWTARRRARPLERSDAVRRLVDRYRALRGRELGAIALISCANQRAALAVTFPRRGLLLVS